MDAVWARGPLTPMLMPTPLTTPRGPHREPTVLDTTAMATGASGLPMPSATTAMLPLWELPVSTPLALPTVTGPHRDLASVRLRPTHGVTPHSTPGGPLPSATPTGPPRDSASVRLARRPWLPTPMAPPPSSDGLSGDSQPRLLRSVRPSLQSLTPTGPPRAPTATAMPQPTTGDKNLASHLSPTSLLECAQWFTTFCWNL